MTILLYVLIALSCFILWVAEDAWTVLIPALAVAALVGAVLGYLLYGAALSGAMWAFGIGGVVLPILGMFTADEEVS